MSRYSLMPWSFRDLYNAVNDDFAWFDQYANPTSSSWTIRGEFVDTDKFDVKITPKESYKKELISQKEKEIEQLDKQRKQVEADLQKLKEGNPLK